MGVKYKDPLTGNFVDLSVKVADTLPIGTEVDFDGTAIPPGWQEVISGEWNNISSDYGTLYYKQLSDTSYFLQGSFSGHTDAFLITLPFTVTRQQVFLLPGNGLYYSKAYINANSNKLGIVVGTGTTSTAYSLNVLVVTD